MPSLMLLVFLLQLAIYLVNTLGATTINDWVRTPPHPSTPSPPR